MQIEIQIFHSDYSLGFNLIERPRFPDRRGIIVPGEAIIMPFPHTYVVGDEVIEENETIFLKVEVNEDTDIAEFANWLCGKLKEHEEKIFSISVEGAKIPIDEAALTQAIENVVKKTIASRS